MAVKTIGCFEIEELSPGRWKVRNTLTSFEHVSYGTPQEMKVACLQQTEAWERRIAKDGASKKQKGSAWRNKPAYVPKEQRKST